MTTALPEWIDELVGPVDDVHAVFDAQDSGNVGFGLTVRRDRFFVKLATTPRALEGLHRAALLHATVRHPAIVPLVSILRSVEGTALLYPWVDGSSLYAPANKRKRAKSAPGRFRALPVPEITAALDTVYDAHLAIADAGFVSSDLYDGSLIYDADTGRIHLVDLDEYRPGPFALTEDRALGSKRFMAPEEFRQGATIDPRTTVFHLARLASILLDEGDDTGVFRGSEAAHEVAGRGQHPDPDQRHPNVHAFVAAWRTAQG